MNDFESVVSKLVMKREGLKISQRQVAEAMGVSQSVIATLESLRHEPRSSLLFDYASVLGERLDIKDRKWSPLTARECAIGMRASLVRGGRKAEIEVFRWVVQFINDGEQAVPEQKTQSWTGRPVTVGQPRFDSLLGGVIEQICLNEGISPPVWIFEPNYYCEVLQFFAPTRGLEALAMANAWPALSVRGVFVDGSDLESV